MHIGIIGAGMMGLTTAFYLSREGVKVTILEKEKKIGGLSRSEEILPGVHWDRFYHVILSTDKELLEFIKEIGLSLDVRFRETKTGFYTDGKLYSLSNTQEFLKFPPLSFPNKIRLGAGIFYASKINNWKRLEKIYARTWLTRVFGQRNYEKMWDPLLRSKLGTAREQASAAFIWAIIKRYYGTRHTRSKKEMMGCAGSGYHSILKQLVDHLSKNGVDILTGYNVKKVLSSNNSESICVQSEDGKEFQFDRIIATTPNPVIIHLWPDMPPGFKSQLEGVKYLSIICLVLVLKKSLTPFYVTNITDNWLPFTGLIEASNVIPSETLGGKTLVYLPKWLPAGDPFYKKSNEEIFDIFVKSLGRMFRDFSEDQIISRAVHRETYVQPIQEIHYSSNIPYVKTPLENFYMVNTTMIINSTLNNNEVIKLARKAAELVSSS
jgi:protoporphyrinogen oxidase